jgi:hypothetical protein
MSHPVYSAHPDSDNTHSLSLRERVRVREALKRRNIIA